MRVLAAPTATQNFLDVHDTPFSVLYFAPLGAGVGWIDQVEPFQRSASGALCPPTDVVPTAVHAVADVHDTALSAPTPGEETTAQFAAAACEANARDVRTPTSAIRRMLHFLSARLASPRDGDTTPRPGNRQYIPIPRRSNAPRALGAAFGKG